MSYTEYRITSADSKATDPFLFSSFDIAQIAAWLDERKFKQYRVISREISNWKEVEIITKIEAKERTWKGVI